MSPNDPTVVDSSVDEDNDYDFLQQTKQRRFGSRFITRSLVGLVVLTGVFWGGVAVQKTYGTSGISGPAGQGGAQFARNPSARSNTNGSAGSSSSNRTSGSVVLVDGSTVYVNDSSGNTVKVSLANSSKITKTVTGTSADIKTGDTVTVQGSSDSDGNLAASSIAVSSQPG